MVESNCFLFLNMKEFENHPKTLVANLWKVTKL